MTNPSLSSDDHRRHGAKPAVAQGGMLMVEYSEGMMNFESSGEGSCFACSAGTPSFWWRALSTNFGCSDNHGHWLTSHRWRLSAIRRHFSTYCSDRRGCGSYWSRYRWCYRRRSTRTFRDGRDWWRFHGRSWSSRAAANRRTTGWIRCIRRRRRHSTSLEQWPLAATRRPTGPKSGRGGSTRSAPPGDRCLHAANWCPSP